MENHHSIIFRSGLTMGGIVLLALLSMVAASMAAAAGSRITDCDKSSCTTSWKM
ncbi:MAG: hypothetical protein P9F19_00220 [Candidatus Contendobacter sp.]|nr:hypothetical protein [Candidatus Contendobacter sp.]